MTDAERQALRQWRERVAAKLGRTRRIRQGDRLVALEYAVADWCRQADIAGHDPGDEDRT